jgi:adenylate cyclase
LKSLFGPEEGWSLAPVAAWLLHEGRGLTEPIDLINGLAAQLDKAGAHVDRLRFTSGTLHPQLLAWGAFWNRGTGAELWEGRHGILETDAYVGSPAQAVREQHKPFRRRLQEQGEGALVEGRDHVVLHEMRAEGMTDYYAVPLVYSDGQVSFFALATTSPRGFDDGDLERFDALVNLVAPLIEILNARRVTLGLLDAFVGPRISERILRGQVKRGDGDRIEAAFWYSDLRGFTRLSETLEPERLLRLLNDYFEQCATAAAARGGEILQFIGDAILIVFETRSGRDEPAVCEAALEAAIDAFASIAVVNHQRRRSGEPQIAFGLGLHVGSVTHANVGAPYRLAFNVVGPAVNKTARIEALTKEAGVPLLMSREFAGRIARPLRSIGTFDLRGVAGTQELFALAETIKP